MALKEAAGEKPLSVEEAFNRYEALIRPEFERVRGELEELSKRRAVRELPDYPTQLRVFMEQNFDAILRMIREEFLRQSAFSETDASCPPELWAILDFVISALASGSWKWVTEDRAPQSVHAIPQTPSGVSNRV